MKNDKNHLELKNLGFNDWFQSKRKESHYSEHGLARVTVVIRDR